MGLWLQVIHSVVIVVTTIAQLVAFYTQIYIVHLWIGVDMSVGPYLPYFKSNY